MRNRVATVCILTFSLVAGSSAAPALANQVPPPPLAGTYSCVQNGFATTSAMPGVPSQVTVTPMANLFGDLILDGKGGYRMTGGKNVAGRYTQDRTNGAVRFTGLLGGFSNNYYVRDRKVFFDFNSGAISFSCTRGGSTFAGTAGARVDQSGHSPASPSGPPNGNLVGTLYFTKSDGLYRLDLARGSEAFVREGRSFDLAPDGQLVWVNKAGDMMLGSEDGPAREVSTFGSNADPRFSPDGSRIAYMGELRSSNEYDAILAANSNASVQPLVIDRSGRLIASFGTSYMQPVWTPDGRVVVAGTKASGSLMGNAATGIYISDRKLRGLQRIDPGYELPHSPAVSPDGTKIAFVSGRSIVVMGIDGSNARSIANGKTAFVGAPTWSPNGDTILFKDERQLWSAPLAGKPAVVSGDNGYPVSAWSIIVWRP